MIGSTILLVAAAGLGGSAAAPNWVEAGTDDMGSVWYVDVAGSGFEDSPIRFTVRVDHREDRTTTARETIREAEVACADHRYRIVRTTLYDAQGNGAEKDEGGPDGPFFDIVPDSIFSAVERVACGLAQQGEETVAGREEPVRLAASSPR
jgi:hypothetical protein